MRAKTNSPSPAQRQVQAGAPKTKFPSVQFQIKHLGYRIELGEIEHAVLQMDGIRDACGVYQPGRKEITLFFESDQELSPAVIRQRLEAFLPKHMLPTVFHRMEHLPRNPNSKIDRQALMKAS
jgi:acyl-coenzyme A synthetase/AMP-(fatty) acid ligase